MIMERNYKIKTKFQKIFNVSICITIIIHIIPNHDYFIAMDNLFKKGNYQITKLIFF